MNRITDQDTYRTPGQPDKGADLRAALHAAVEAGVIEGWRVHVDPGAPMWSVSLTTEQACNLLVMVDEADPALVGRVCDVCICRLPCQCGTAW